MITVSSLQVPTSSAAPASSAGDPGEYVAVKNEPESVSGEALLVAAYAAIWVVLMFFVVVAWRRTRSLEDKVTLLERAVSKVQPAATTPTTKRSPSEEV